MCKNFMRGLGGIVLVLGWLSTAVAETYIDVDFNSDAVGGDPTCNGISEPANTDVRVVDSTVPADSADPFGGRSNQSLLYRDTGINAAEITWSTTNRVVETNSVKLTMRYYMDTSSPYEDAYTVFRIGKVDSASDALNAGDECAVTLILRETDILVYDGAVNYFMNLTPNGISPNTIWNMEFNLDATDQTWSMTINDHEMEVTSTANGGVVGATTLGYNSSEISGINAFSITGITAQPQDANSYFDDFSLALTNGTTLIDVDFDSDTIGENPAGIMLISEPEGTDIRVVGHPPFDPFGGAGNRSLLYEDTGDDVARLGWTTEGFVTVTNNMTLSTKFYLDKSGAFKNSYSLLTGGNVASANNDFLDSVDELVFTLILLENLLLASDSNSANGWRYIRLPAPPNTVWDMDIDINVLQQTWTVSINGELLFDMNEEISDFAFRNSFNGINAIGIGGITVIAQGTPRVYFDDIKLSTPEYAASYDGSTLDVALGDYTTTFTKEDSWTMSQVLFKNKSFLNGSMQSVLNELNPPGAEAFLGSGYRPETNITAELLAYNQGVLVQSVALDSSFSITNIADRVVVKKTSQFYSTAHGLFFDHVSEITMEPDHLREDYWFTVGDGQEEYINYIYPFMHQFPNETQDWICGDAGSRVTHSGGFTEDATVTNVGEILWFSVYNPTNEVALLLTYPEVYSSNGSLGNQFQNGTGNHAHYWRANTPSVSSSDNQFHYSSEIWGREVEESNWKADVTNSVLTEIEIASANDPLLEIRYLPSYKKIWVDFLDMRRCDFREEVEIVRIDVMKEGETRLSEEFSADGDYIESLTLNTGTQMDEEGTYCLIVSMVRDDGLVLNQITREYEWTDFAFLGSTAGTSLDILAPFIPLVRTGRSVESLSSECSFSEAGLPVQIQAEQSEPTVGAAVADLLASPMALTIWNESETNALESVTPFTVVQEERDLIVFESVGKIGDLDVSFTNRVEQDGMCWFEMTLSATQTVVITNLTLDIPLVKEQATLFYEIADRARNFCAGSFNGGDEKVWISNWSLTESTFPTDDGVVWNSMQATNIALKTGIFGIKGNFKPMIWLGNEDRGLTWFAETDRYWSLDWDKPAMEIVRDNDETILRVHFINQTLTMEAGDSRTIPFGLLPTPVKPLPNQWRSWRVYAPSTNNNLQNVEIRADLYTNVFTGVNAYTPYPLNYEYQPAAEFIKTNYHDKGIIYLDYQIIGWLGRMAESPEGLAYKGEWGKLVPRDFDTTECAFLESFQLFKSWAYDQYLKNIGFYTLYEDCAWPGPLFDKALDVGYERPDGGWQSEFPMLGMRKAVKRNVAVWEENHMPNMYGVHKTAATATPAHSFAAITIDGEQLPQTNSAMDYIDQWPLENIRAYVMGRQFGHVPYFISQMRMTGCTDAEKEKAFRTFYGLLMLHDVIAWPGSWHYRPARDAVHGAVNYINIGSKKIDFYPYWGLGDKQVVTPSSSEVEVTIWKNEDTLLAIILNRGETQTVEVQFDSAKLGLPFVSAVNYESGQNLSIASDTLSVEVERHDFQLVVLSSKASIDLSEPLEDKGPLLFILSAAE